MDSLLFHRNIVVTNYFDKPVRIRADISFSGEMEIEQQKKYRGNNRKGESCYETEDKQNKTKKWNRWHIIAADSDYVCVDWFPKGKQNYRIR